MTTSEQNEPVRYQLTVSEQEAKSGTKKLLPRNNKKIEVKIPAGISSGGFVKLTNALQVTDGRAGDILIEIIVKAERTPLTESVEVNETNFESEVLVSASPVVVDFWANWCGPCRMVAPIIAKLADEYQGRIKFCKLNVDDNPQVAAQYQAMSIPLLLFFKNGKVVDRIVGAVPESQIKAKIEPLL